MALKGVKTNRHYTTKKVRIATGMPKKDMTEHSLQHMDIINIFSFKKETVENK
jgi:hypothetical protein